MSWANIYKHILYCILYVPGKSAQYEAKNHHAFWKSHKLSGSNSVYLLDVSGVVSQSLTVVSVQT